MFTQEEQDTAARGAGGSTRGKIAASNIIVTALTLLRQLIIIGQII